MGRPLPNATSLTTAAALKQTASCFLVWQNGPESPWWRWPPRFLRPSPPPQAPSFQEGGAPPESSFLHPFSLPATASPSLHRLEAVAPQSGGAFPGLCCGSLIFSCPVSEGCDLSHETQVQMLTWATLHRQSACRERCSCYHCIKSPQVLKT